MAPFFSRPFTPFFQPTAPPPALPVLTSQTELFSHDLDNAHQVTSIIAHEELLKRSDTGHAKMSPAGLPKPRSSRDPHVRFENPMRASANREPGPSRNIQLCFDNPMRAHTSRKSKPTGDIPVRFNTPIHVRISREPSNAGGSSDSSSNKSSPEPLDSDSGCEASDSDDGLIRQPKGEPGRPGRGGYNLQDAVGWSSLEYKRLKVM
jgi:hypothetical protein